MLRSREHDAADESRGGQSRANSECHHSCKKSQPKLPKQDRKQDDSETAGTVVVGNMNTRRRRARPMGRHAVSVTRQISLQLRIAAERGSLMVQSICNTEGPVVANETFQTQVAASNLHFVTLRLQSSNPIRFQADTGAQCNVVPLRVDLPRILH